MSSNEVKHLRNLLTSFNATFIGEGDTNAGTNLLVTMAVTLANVSRAGSGVLASGCAGMQAGANLMVSGALSSSLVTDSIVQELAKWQNNAIAHMRRLIGDKIADARKKGLKMVEFPAGPRANAAENALFQLEQKESFVPLDVLEKWAEVLQCPPNPRIDDLVVRPKVLVTATGPRDLDRQLCGLHGNRPLVALSLNRPADATGLAETCGAILNGLLPAGEGGETVMGDLLITDPGNLLAKIAPGAGDETKWLGRMVWLVDGDDGPDAEEADADEDNVDEDNVCCGNMIGRFEKALIEALAKRLNNHDAGVVVHEFDLVLAQFRWVRFLKEMETQLPGISGTARGLLGTLAFGLLELANANANARNRKQLPVTPEGVEALGRWIIHRMANARTEMLYSAELEWLMKTAYRIFLILEHGRLSERDIYRPLNLQADRCRFLMCHMEADGMLCRIERKWGRVEGAAFSDSLRNRLILEG